MVGTARTVTHDRPIAWRPVTDFQITIPDTPGSLVRFSAMLREADVNLIGLWGLGGHGAQATFHCIPESPDQFRNFLASEDMPCEEGTVFFLSGADRAGALVRTLEQVAALGINLRRIQSVSMAGEFGCFIWADPKDWNGLLEVLG